MPPSVNHYVRHFRSGGHKVTDEATAFKWAVSFAVKSCYVPAKRFSVTLYIVLGKGDHGDVDNFPKLCLDGLADAGVFRDPRGKPSSDAHVRHLVVVVDSDSRPDEGYTRMTVEEI